MLKINHCQYYINITTRVGAIIVVNILLSPLSIPQLIIILNVTTVTLLFNCCGSDRVLASIFNPDSNNFEMIKKNKNHDS